MNYLKVLVVFFVFLLGMVGIYLTQLHLQQPDIFDLVPSRSQLQKHLLQQLQLRQFKKNWKTRRGGVGIPHRIVLTSKDGELKKLPLAVQANVRRMLKLNPGFKPRWFSDHSCQTYLKRYYRKTKLPDLFASVERGSYRGDICRAAVLAREGGFYADVDVEMKLSFKELAGPNVTFLASYSEDGSVLNAMMGAVPHSPIMEEALTNIVRWQTNQTPPGGWGTTSEWMGPTTMLAALKAVKQRDCPSQDKTTTPSDYFQFAADPELELNCSKEVIRMFRERGLDCDFGSQEDCPQARRDNPFDGVKFGIFDKDFHIVAWPRFADCNTWGCDSGGWPTDPPAAWEADPENSAPGSGALFSRGAGSLDEKTSQLGEEADEDDTSKEGEDGEEASEAKGVPEVV